MEKKTKQRVIDIIQWVLIALLCGICIFQGLRHRGYIDDFIAERRDNSYKMIYYSQNIEVLKERNRELYQTIDSLRNVESAVEIKYVYRYKTDTIRVKDVVVNMEDSTYRYSFDNDTIQFNMSAKAQNLEWMEGNFAIHDNFKVVTTNHDDNLFTTTVYNSPNVEIEDVTAWRKKKNWYDNFHFGPSVGVGYGVMNNKLDIYVGVSVGYNIW